jgi:hypothetical protein
MAKAYLMVFSGTCMLRGNSRLRQEIGPQGVRFLEHAAGAVNRILPHVEVSAWTERAEWLDPDAVWTSNQRTGLRMTVSIGARDQGRSLTAVVQRRGVPTQQNADRRVLDLREQDICRRIARQLSNVLGFGSGAANGASLRAISALFDEHVVTEHIREHHLLTLELSEVFGALHTLAEQTYENKALTFGCIIEPTSGYSSAIVFPKDFFTAKKYRALSDGYRTAYHLASSGQVLNFVDLDDFDSRSLTRRHFYPQWAESMARASRDHKCGIALSRQGDLLVFDEGTLRFTYRNGLWQYWNHAHLVTLLRDRARAQHVPPAFLGRLVGNIYRAALDISFRRTGGLFVVLRNQHNLRKIVRLGDAIGDPGRAPVDLAFDSALHGPGGIFPRSVIVELASLDGAIVLDNSATVLAYGAVLRPRRTGRLHGSEGSRTKAAIGASHYGLSVKVSSDGDITVYHNGKQFISV